MPKQTSASSSNSVDSFPVLKQEESPPSPILADSTPHLDLFCQEIDDCFEIDKVPELTLSIPEATKVSSWTYQLEPATPIVLSPTSSASSPISTRNVDFTWDSPCTPHTPLQRRCHANKDPATPLTPPGSSEGTSKDRVNVAGLAFGTPSPKSFNNDESDCENETHGKTLGASVRRLQPLFQSSQL